MASLVANQIFGNGVRHDLYAIFMQQTRIAPSHPCLVSTVQLKFERAGKTFAFLRRMTCRFCFGPALAFGFLFCLLVIGLSFRKLAKG